MRDREDSEVLGGFECGLQLSLQWSVTHFLGGRETETDQCLEESDDKHAILSSHQLNEME